MAKTILFERHCRLPCLAEGMFRFALTSFCWCSSIRRVAKKLLGKRKQHLRQLFNSDIKISGRQPCEVLIEVRWMCGGLCHKTPPAHSTNIRLTPPLQDCVWHVDVDETERENWETRLGVCAQFVRKECLRSWPWSYPAKHECTLQAYLAGEAGCVDF